MLKIQVYALCLLFLFGCAKDRDEEIVQSASHNLESISDYQGKEFDLEVLGPMGESVSSLNTKALNADIRGAEGRFGVSVVSYRTATPLLGDVPIMAKMSEGRNVHYKIKYEINEKFLVLYKIASERDLPPSELTYGERLNDGRYKVPLVGYPVTLFRLENIRNGNNENTHQLTTVVTNDLTQATHFKTDFLSPVPFDAVKKADVYRSDYFDGEWFYAVTVAEASSEKQPKLGRLFSQDARFDEASRIKFERDESALVGRNLNADPDLNLSEPINLVEVIRIGAEFVDYRQKTENGVKLLAEEELGKEHEERKNISERNFVKVNFEEVRTIHNTSIGVTGLNQYDTYAAAIMGGHGLSIKRLDEIEMTENYFSFLIYYPNAELKLRYSFKRAHQPKKPRIYFKDDRLKFGYFPTIRNHISDYTYQYYGDGDKKVFLRRFYPENGKITYHFSQNTPEHLREMGHRAIESWNKVFKETNTGIELEVNTDFDVKLGDIRYNILNLIDTQNGSRLYGFGPSVADSHSGEIISTSANIYANPSRETWIEVLRNFIRAELGMFDHKYLEDPKNEPLDGPVSLLDTALEEIKTNALNLKEDLRFISYRDLLNEDIPSKEVFELLLAEKEERFPEAEQLTNQTYQDIHDEFMREMRRLNGDISLVEFGETHPLHMMPFQLQKAHDIKLAEKYCSDSFMPYLEKVKDYFQFGDTVRNMRPNEIRDYYRDLRSTENDVLRKCADQAVPHILLGVLVHEIGHNLGLRHNFYGSIDKRNFDKNDENVVEHPSSSVMEYTGAFSEMPAGPRSYDREAIRFGYANTVKLEDGSLFEFNLDTSMTEQLAELGKARHEYLYCSDLRATAPYKVDPMCSRQDQGTTPLEKVRKIVNSFHSSYAVYGHRHDRINGQRGMTFARRQLRYKFMELLQIYQEWRFRLREFIGSDRQYLTFAKNESSMQEVLEEMKNSSIEKHAKDYELYYQASKEVFEFFHKLVMTPAKYCVGALRGAGAGAIRYHDFQIVQQNAYNDTGVVIKTCSQAQAQEVLKSMGSVYIGEFGAYHTDQRETLDPHEDEYHLINAAGFKMIRHLASFILVSRLPQMSHLIDNDFRPAFVDNPEYRSKLIGSIAERVINGLDGERFGFPTAVREERFRFYRELEVLSDLFESLGSIGASIPGKIGLNRDPRLKIVKSTGGLRLPQGWVTTIYQNAVIIGAPAPTDSKESITGRLINLRNELVAKVESLDSEQLTVEALEEIIEDLKSEESPVELLSAEEMAKDEFTGAHLNDYLASIIQAMASSYDKYSEKSLELVIANSILGFNELFPKLQELVKAESSELEKPAREVYAQLIDGIEGVPSFEEFGNKKAITERMDAFKTEAWRQFSDTETLVRRELLKNRTDIEAHLELVTRILLRI